MSYLKRHDATIDKEDLLQEKQRQIKLVMEVMLSELDLETYTRVLKKFQEQNLL